MAMNQNNQSTFYGTQIPTTQSFDISELLSANLDPKLQEVLIKLYKNLNNMAIAVNNKDSGYYNTNVSITGQQFFPNPALSSASSTYPSFRPVFRLVINAGAVAATSTVTVAHGLTITPTWNFTRIYGTANYYNSTPTNSFYAPLPYADATNAGTTNIELYADGTNVYIVNNTGTSFTTSNVILEWMIT